jgi:broad specificity phosphatase PhoE
MRPGLATPRTSSSVTAAHNGNLDQTGREQAKRLGDQFTSRRITVGAVLASQWCRTSETAEIAFQKRVRKDASFNSFLGESASQPA